MDLKMCVKVYKLAGH